MGSRSRKRVPGVMSLLLGAAGWLFLMPGLAGAQGIAQGPNYHYTKIYNYYNFNVISTTTGQPAQAFIWVFKTGSGNVPAGYMSGLAIMFKTHTPPIVCRMTTWQYNSTASAGLAVDAKPGCGAGPVYFSFGDSRAYNGSGYTTYGSYRSPSETS